MYLCLPGTGWPSYIPRHGFPFRRLLRLAGLRWGYSNSPPHGAVTPISGINMWSKSGQMFSNFEITKHKNLLGLIIPRTKTLMEHCIGHVAKKRMFYFSLHFFETIFVLKLTKLNSLVLGRKRTTPTERPQPVGEVSANFSW
jgi:hypothetical protein